MSNNSGPSNPREEIKRQIRFDKLFSELYPSHYSGRSSKCPWHDDHHNSLEVHEYHAFCHAGCTPSNGAKSWDSISLWMRAGGVSFKTALTELGARCGIQAEPAPQSKREPVEVYPYHNESGVLLYQVCRSDGKDFPQRRPDPNRPGEWVWNLEDTRRVLYGLSEVLRTDTVWLAEGEKDANNLTKLGLCGTTSPGGAGKWPGLVEKYAIHEPLRGKTVYILPDNDKAGKEHAQDVVQTLHGFAASVKILPLPGLQEKGDVSDFIQQRGPEEAKRQLLEIAERTQEYKPPRTGPEIISLQDLMAMEITEPRWVVHGLIPEGLGLLAAKPKSGKSFLIAIISLAVAQGRAALGHFLTNQAATLSLCLEDNPRRMKKRYSLMLGDNLPPDNHFTACEWPPFDKKGVNLLHKTLEDHPEIKLVSIDTWGRFRPRRGRVDDVYSSDYADLQELHSLASMFGVAILLIHHLRKETSDDAVDGILGSTALSGAADSILILKRKSRTDSDAVLSVTGRDIPDQEHALSFDAGIWTYKGNPLELRLSSERREIREVLGQAGRPMTPTEIAELTGRKLSATHNLLSKMVDAGEIERGAQRGRYVLPPEDELYGSTHRRGPGDGTCQEEIYLDQI